MEEVIVYVLDINKLDLTNIPYLKEEDFSNAYRYKMREDQNQHLLSAYLKRRFIKDYYIDKDGKPLSFDIYFNISHAANLVVMATNKNCPVGIDIELIRHVDDDLRRYVSNDEEYQYIKDDIHFFQIWTSKESLFKASQAKAQVKDIKALPIEGLKEYFNDLYYAKNRIFGDFIISVTLKCKDDFKIKMVEVEEL